MAKAIDVVGLVKSYGSHRAVDGVDLSVEEGEIVAFLGPNGAGKTSTIEVLEGYRERDSGSVSVLGEDPAKASTEWRERVGIVLQESQLIEELSAIETIRMHSRYYRASRDPEEVLGLVGLADSADQRGSKLSGGQKRRLDLALALIGDPELVFLDEPTTGFDPSARRESWSMIEALRETGCSVLLTTHYMDEAEQLADRIVVIAGGRVVANGTAADLADLVGARTTVSWRPGPSDPAPPPGLAAVATGDTMTLSPTDLVADLHALTGWAREANVHLDGLAVKQPTLEDVYLTLTADASPTADAEPGSEAS
ncbi:MAG: ABC transporter ATP-binding protein [Actinomycetota bacterium]